MAVAVVHHHGNHTQGATAFGGELAHFGTFAVAAFRGSENGAAFSGNDKRNHALVLAKRCRAPRAPRPMARTSDSLKRTALPAFESIKISCVPSVMVTPTKVAFVQLTGNQANRAWTAELIQRGFFTTPQAVTINT